MSDREIEGLADSDCLKSAGNDSARKVVKACEKHWEGNKSDCNHFLKAVARELGIMDFEGLGNADSIIAHLEKPLPGWTKLARGGHKEAHDQAKAGAFVVAGMTSADSNQNNGHVTVVTCGELVFSGQDGVNYPRGYWGRLNSVGDHCKGLNYSFPEGRKTKLRYYWRALP